MQAPENITSLPELDYVLRESSGRPVVIFKHSTRCGVSAHAFQAYRDWVATRERGPMFTFIEVPGSRSVSDALAHRTGVRHQTPQAMVVRDGSVTWWASHWDISDEALNRALAETDPAAD